MKMLVAMLGTALLLAGPALAQDGKTGPILIEHPWARAAATANSAAYLTLENTGTEADRLIGVATAAARSSELHSTSVDAQGVASMRPVQAIELPAGGQAQLAPGGLHIMLMGLTQPLEVGQHFPLSLTFEKAGLVTVEVAVEGRPTAGHTHQKPMQMGN